MAAIPVLASGMASGLQKKDNPYYTGEANTITLHGKTYRIVETPLASIPTKAGNENPVVITDPKGTEKIYSKNCAGTALLYGNLVFYEDDFPATVVWGDNNDVYFKDILSTVIYDTYIKGEKKGDIITLKTGQIVDFTYDDPDYGDYGMAVGIGRTEISGNEFMFYYDPSITEFSIKVNPDGTMNLELPGEPFDGEQPTEYILCYYYTDDLKFAGYSDFAQAYTPQEMVPVTMPEGVKTEQYVFVDEYDYASFVEVAFTDDYIYFLGLNPMMENSVMRATITGKDTAYIPQNQYLGIYMDMYFEYTHVAYDNPDYDKNDPESSPFINAPEDAVFNLRIDREKGKIIADTPGVYLVMKPDEDTFFNAIFYLSQFTLTYQESAYGTPSVPTGLNYFTELAYYQGFNDFQFRISNYSTAGTLLDAEYLLYSVILNGERIIFSQNTIKNVFGYDVTPYAKVPEEQIWLPFLFSNDDDIFKLSMNEFDIGIYTDDVKTLGVQTLYVYGGKATYSDIATLDVETGQVTITDKVEPVYNGEIETVEYFDLEGRRVEKPLKGLIIKRVKYSDGKISVDKQLMR